MEIQYHIEICRRALGELVSSRALDTIIQANIRQDNLRGQFGHPEFHFDANAFQASYNYMEEQRQIILDSVKNGDNVAAWEAFGRLTHTGQDFYAHSNYLSLWIESHPQEKQPSIPEVKAMIPKFLDHPHLKSGKIYLWDYLAYLPGLYKIAGQILPQDSHYHMNLDHPDRGPLFPYAFEAAVKRTNHEFEQIQTQIESQIGKQAVSAFLDR